MHRFARLLCLSLLWADLRTDAAFAEGSATDWSQAIYQNEIFRRADGKAVSQQVFLWAFTPSLREIWLAARKGPGPRLDGPILNAYLGWGVLPAIPLELEAVVDEVQDEREARVWVDLRIRGVPRHATLQLLRVEQTWRAADVVYGGESFRTLQQICATQLC